MMSRIRAKDTKPEMIVRRGLHAAGFRYRLHVKGLPAKPDIVLKKYRAVIFIHGCFWHGHAGCGNFKLPKTRSEFWRTKIEGNRSRDERAVDNLLGTGWRVLIIWECATKSIDVENLVSAAATWLHRDCAHAEFDKNGIHPLDGGGQERVE